MEAAQLQAIPSTPVTGIQHAKLIIITFEIMEQYDVKKAMLFCISAYDNKKYIYFHVEDTGVPNRNFVRSNLECPCRLSGYLSPYF
jgi:hypothetical protein